MKVIFQSVGATCPQRNSFSDFGRAPSLAHMSATAKPIFIRLTFCGGQKAGFSAARARLDWHFFDRFWKTVRPKELSQSTSGKILNMAVSRASTTLFILGKASLPRGSSNYQSLLKERTLSRME